MTEHLRPILTGLLAVGLLSGCGNDGSPTGQGGNGDPMTARINGSSWTPDASLTGAELFQADDILVIRGGSTSTYAIAIYLNDATAPGTYPFGIFHPVRWAGMSTITGGSWSSGNPGGSGSATITTYTQNRVAGTFQFTAPADGTSSESGTLTVTNGQFDLPLTRLP